MVGPAQPTSRALSKKGVNLNMIFSKAHQIYGDSASHTAKRVTGRQPFLGREEFPLLQFAAPNLDGSRLSSAELHRIETLASALAAPRNPGEGASSAIVRQQLRYISVT